MRHTPGPWMIDPELPLAVIQDTADGYGIAEIAPRAEQEANALLIALSPELHEVVRLLSERDDGDPLVRDAVKLITKIERGIQ